VYNQTVCTPPDACSTASCDPDTGLCTFSQIQCNDNIKCTLDTCNPATGCVFTAVVCDDNTQCSVGTCNNITGGCSFKDVDCDDNISCTIDECVVGLGCKNTAFDSLCENPDVCVVNGGCDPDNGGCVFTPLDCGVNTLYCKNLSCFSFIGCRYTPRNCFNNVSRNTTCTTYNCSEAQRACVPLSLPCYVFAAILVVLAGGIIAAIIIAGLLLAGALAGSSVYAVSANVEEHKEQAISNNPLYHGKGKFHDVKL